MARTRKTKPQPLFERRTLTVWAALVAALTVVSGLLLVLDPTPHAPAVGPVLTVLDPSPDDLEGLLATYAPVQAGQWQAIIVNHSGTRRGSAESLGRQHQSQGWGGLNYHFVIGNGQGAHDGEIQAGYRWNRQLSGVQYRDAVTICLIGDGDQIAPSRAQTEQLVKLVTSLQHRLGIPAERVYLHRELAQTTSPGLLFPANWFRRQLIEAPTHP